MHTTTSKDSILITDSVLPKSRSSDGHCVIIEIDKWRDLATEATPKTSSLSDVVREYEANPERKAALENARRKLATSLSALGEPNSLREYRLRKGLSQAALANLIGSTQAQIARIESGKQDVQIGTMVRLATALEVEPIAAIKAFLAQVEGRR